MSVSPEVKLAVDEIHRERDALVAAAKANALQASQIADLNAKIAALPVGNPLSAEDKKALLDAVNHVGETTDALAVAVPANVDTSVPPAPPAVPPAALPSDPLAPRPDPIAGTGQGVVVPLMPNSSFDPTAGGAVAAGQARPIATAGGFVVSGGGVVQRAPDAPLQDAGIPAGAVTEPMQLPPANPPSAPIAPPVAAPDAPAVPSGSVG